MNGTEFAVIAMAADHNCRNRGVDPAPGETRRTHEARPDYIVEPLSGYEVNMPRCNSLGGADVNDLKALPCLQRPDELQGRNLRNGL